MEKQQGKNSLLSKMIDTSRQTAQKVAGVAVGAASTVKDSIDNAVQKANAKVEEKKQAAEAKSQEQYDNAMEAVQDAGADDFLHLLGDSPVKLTPARGNKIKATFPIPREQYILWADAEFDLRPSGITATNKGIYIRTNVGYLDGKKGISNQALDTMSEEEQQAYKDHYAQFHSGKSTLLFYDWADFDPAWFSGESELQNKALLVEPQCSQKFIEVCRAYASSMPINNEQAYFATGTDQENITPLMAGGLAGAAVESAQSAVFVEQKAAINTPAGHGEMAEEANTLLDKMAGMKAKVVGRDNAKDGADRLVDDIFIQSKYYKSARGSLEACFHPDTGEYRYMHDGQPMQLEVPKDQYEKVLKGFEQKIKDGKVPGVTDPKDAEKFVRKGRLTYQQAVNLTKPGTIESLTYDALTGAVICSCAMGLTFVVTVFLTWRKTGDIREAVQAGTAAGLQIFGLSFVQHMLVSQIARTSLANSLLTPSQYLVGKLGYQASATIVNGIRALSGKGAIYGAAASKHLAKILRSNVMTSVIAFAVFSIPETYNVAARKISGAQYVKNMSVLAGSIVAGAGGAVAAGVVAAKVAGAAGTAVAPVVGTAVGVVGGFVGGVVGSQVVKKTGDILHEDDTETLGRMFNAYVSCMIGEYFLDEQEIDQLIEKFNQITTKQFKTLFSELEAAEKQEETIRKFLTPYFEKTVCNRDKFTLPSSENMIEALAVLM